MAPLARILGRDCRVLAVDLPGFGLSGKPGRALTLPELTDTLAAWAPAVGLDRASYLASSLGCQILTDLAVRYPERVAQLVLQGPSVEAGARSTLRQLFRFQINSAKEAQSLMLVTLRDYYDCGLRRLYRTFRHALEDRIEDRLGRVQAPTLVVRGSKDRIISQAWAEEVTRLLPHGRLVVVPGAPHAMSYSAPLELARVVRPFLAEYLQAGPGTAAP